MADGRARRVIPSRRVLPGPEEREAWRHLVATYKSDQGIADHIQRTTGQAVKRQAVWEQRTKAGVPAQRTGTSRGYGRHKDRIPWRVNTRHADDLIHECLRLDSRDVSGDELTAKERRALRQFRAFMRDPSSVVGYPVKDPAGGLCGPLVVCYDSADVEGFWLTPAKPGEGGLVRRPGGPFDH